MDDDFIADDFIPDPPQQQGKIENTENLLQRVINSAGAAIPTLGGPLTEGIVEPSKFPDIGQTAGNVLGTTFGVGPIVGGAAGRGIGDVIKSSLENLYGRSNKNIKEIGTGAAGQAGLGATTEIGGKILGAIGDATIFAKPAKEYAKKTAGKALGKVKSALLEKSGSLGKAQEFIKPVIDAIERLESKFLRNPEILNELKSVKNDFQRASSRGSITFDDVESLRGRLDDVIRSKKVYGAPPIKQTKKTPAAYGEVGDIIQAREEVDSAISNLANTHKLGEQLGKAKSDYATAAKKRDRGLHEYIPLAGVSGMNKLLRGLGSAFFGPVHAFGKVGPTISASIIEKMRGS